MDPNTVINGDSKRHLVTRKGNTGDIIAAIMTADRINAPYVSRFAQTIPGNTLEEICANLWSYVKDNIPYKEDPDGIQIVQSPSELNKNRSIESGGTGKGGDCKSYSNFISACLKNLGIKHYYRFITQDADSDFHHVYICVPTTGKNYIVMDAVMSQFDKEIDFVRHQDKWANMNTMQGAIGAVRSAHMDGSQQEEYDKAASWAQEEAKLKDAYFRDKMIKDVKAMLRDDLYNHWKNKNHIKYAEFRKRLVEKDTAFAALVTASTALSYHFWDESKAPFIDPVTRTLTLELDKKRNYVVTEMYRSLTVDVGFREASLRALCNLGHYFVYGISLDHMLDKSYNMVKFGQPWGPVDGVPYFDFSKKQFIRNGADTEFAKKIELCFPYDGGITRLSGQPYWCHYGFIMKNGADDKTVAEWVKKNPRPTNDLGIWKKDPTPQDEAYFLQQCIPAYSQWLNGNAPGFPKPPAKGFGGAIGRTAVGEAITLSATAIIAIVVAVVTAISTVIGIIINLVNAFKKGNVEQMPCPPSDFRMEYQAADGSYIGVAPAECGTLKAKYNQQTGQFQCLTPADLALPQNQAGAPANGFFNLSSGSSMLFPVGLAVAGGALLISGK